MVFGEKIVYKDTHTTFKSLFQGSEMSLRA